MAVTYDSATGNTSASSEVSATHSLGYASGSNRIVVAFPCAFARKQADSVISAVTYNGTAGTETYMQVSTTEAVNVRIYAYYWLDTSLPASTGSYTVTGTFSKATDCAITVVSIADASQQDADADNGSGDDTAGFTTFSTDITTQTPGAFVIDGAITRAGTTYTADSGQVERYDATIGFSGVVASTRVTTGATTYTQGWTLDTDTGQQYAQIVTAWAPLEEAANPIFGFAGLT